VSAKRNGTPNANGKDARSQSQWRRRRWCRGGVEIRSGTAVCLGLVISTLIS
jgi:hypothetical protein